MSVKLLFDSTILDWYSTAITTKLAGHRIMSRCDYIRFMKPATTFLNLYTLIENTKDICEGVIAYAKSCLTACVVGDKECMKYNALFLVSPDQTVGFVIIQKGECKDKPDTISIKLICSSFKGGGHILLGAVACCIKKSLFNQEMILDLAGGKHNKIAYSSYKKFGFADTPELRTADCYPPIETNNLVMLLDLSHLTCVDVVRIVRLPSGWRWVKNDVMLYTHGDVSQSEHPNAEPEPEPEPEPETEPEPEPIEKKRKWNGNGGKRKTRRRRTRYGRTRYGRTRYGRTIRKN